MIGCVTGGCAVPLLWITISTVFYGSGASGMFGLLIVSMMLAPIGILVGVLFNVWNGGKVALSDEALRAELQSMLLESLFEYKGLCPPGSREHAFAVAELERRGAGSGKEAGQKE